MDANRVEANKLKFAAEEIIKQDKRQDFPLAKAYAIRSQELCPEIDGISKFLETIEIYLTAATKIGNKEIDYYKVLGVEPTDTVEVMKKQYKKLALSLHPDKNRSTGADGAFQLISEAWMLLSDEEKRKTYDDKIAEIIKKINPTMPTTSTSTSTSAPAPKPTSTPASAPTVKPKAARARKPPCAPAPAPVHRFWATCQHCKAYFEYDIKYLCKLLLCRECKEAFIAKTTGPPPSGYYPKPDARRLRKQNFNIDSAKTEPTSGSGVAAGSSNFGWKDSNFESHSGGESSSTNTRAQMPSTNEANTASMFGMYGSNAQTPHPGANFASAYEQPPPWDRDPSNTVRYSNYHRNSFFGGQGFYQSSNYPSRPFFETTNNGGEGTLVSDKTANVGEQEHQQSKRPFTESNASMDVSRSPKRAKWDFDLNLPPKDE